MKKARKVNEEYIIDVKLLEDLVLEEVKGNFFESSLKFYKEVEEREVRSLSKKQKNWLWELSCILQDRAESRAIVQSIPPKDPVIDPVLPKNNLVNKIISYFKSYLK